MINKVYLSHNYAAREEMQVFAPHFNKEGLSIVSQWVFGVTFNRKVDALMDLRDIDNCDVVIMWADQKGDTPGRGKYVELGYAIAKNKLVCVIGSNQSECVFYYHPNVHWFSKLSEVLQFVKELDS